MKLLFISNLFPDTSEPYRGLDNACLLHHLRAKGCNIRVLSPRPTLPWHSGDRTMRPGDAPLSPRYFGAPYIPKLGGLANHHLMASALRKVWDFKPDVVLASWMFPDACAVSQIAKEKRLPFLAIAQGSDVHGYLQSGLRRRAIVNAMETASAIITRSAELARLLAEAGVSQSKLHPIYNGVDTATFYPGDKHTARTKLGISQERPLVLYVGNFYPVKNPLLLVRAMKSLPELDLVMIGGGPLETEARALAGANVTLAGRRNAPEVAEYLRAADVLCVPSWNEGVPNVILEALHCGRPVVASHVGGIPEIIKNDMLGTLVPAGDESALVAALRTVALHPPPAASIVAHSGPFVWPYAANAYWELLQKAVGSRR